MSDKWSSAKKEMMGKRRFQRRLKGESPGPMVSRKSVEPTDTMKGGTGLSIVSVEKKGRGTGKRRERLVTLGSKGAFYNPPVNLSQIIRDALDPSKAPGPVRTLNDMSEDERNVLEARYGAKIR